MELKRLDDSDIEALKELMGDTKVSSGPSNLDLHSRDESYHKPSRPDVVVWPTCTEDVVKVVKFANGKSCAVTPWCAGTSLEGNPIPVKGGIVIDFNEMNSIIKVSPDDLQVEVEAGIAYKELNKQLRHYGLFFPPDPGAGASLGGMIGNNASGVRTVAYGATRDCVLALEVVTAEGDVLKLGSCAIKSSSGYDLVRLIIGSEGTLGIATKATLRLKGLPPEYLTVVATFSTIQDACGAAGDAVRYGLNPAALELMDDTVVAEINRDQNMSLDEKPMLFMEFHNVNQAALENQFELVETVLNDHQALSIQRGIGSEERERIWEVRHAALESIKRNHTGMSYLLVDTGVPVSRYAEMVDNAKDAVKREGVTGFFWGHAGDGNLHLALMFDPENEAEREKIKRVNRQVVEHSLAVCGTCTGEHGIGVGKTGFMEAEHGTALKYMQRIKNAMDPKGILNPGKIFPE